MVPIIYLYIKIHNKTGLKYFGRTETKDPYSYSGSGTLWKQHLKEHGKDFSTEIFWSGPPSKIKPIALKFSKDNDIVKNNEWANLQIEDGMNGGAKASAETRRKLSEIHLGSKRSKTTRQNISNALKGKKKTNEHKAKMSLAKQGYVPWSKGQKFNEEHRNNIAAAARKRIKVECEHCGLEIQKHMYNRWHGNKCKSITVHPG
jgi:hypothetical protein